MNDHRKREIRLEEIYRAEVRHDIDSRNRPDLKHRIWKFLNSGFGLWLLSSLLLGGISFLYGLHRESSQAKNREEELLQHLDVEIGRRMAVLEYDLGRVAAQPTEYAAKERLFSTLESVRSFPYPAFKEYKGRPLSAVLFERALTTHTQKTRASWMKLFSQATALETQYLSLSNQPPVEPIVTDARRILNQYASLALDLKAKSG